MVGMVNNSACDKKSILLVEDDDRLASLVSEYLQEHEFIVHIQRRGDDAIEHFNPEVIDLVILDISLPGKNGFDVCREIRNQFNGPIMMLTAKGSDFDQVVGLELGADDYVIKPVEPRVLLARTRVLMRRAEANQQFDELTFGKLTISLTSHHVSLNSSPVILTTQEFNCLWMLACSAGRVVSRDTIYQQLRGIEYDGMDRSIDVCVSHLRKKLADNVENPMRIKTIWGKGYLFSPEAWE